ncbi:MAG: hypothetical protein IPG02_00005 [Ignavibacteria bacterium]|nr:hypothetical protein [Ignavibacteria bacterium]
MDYKAIAILKALGKEELREFGKFVNSPYFVGNSSAAWLYEELLKFHPEFSKEELTEEFLYCRVYPGMNFKKETVRKLFHALNSALEKFIAQKNFESKKFDFYDNLFDGYVRLNLHSLGEKCLDECNALLQQSNALNSDYFLNGFKHSTNKASLFISSRPHSNGSAVNEMATALSERAHNLACFFVKELSRSLDNLLSIDRNFDLRTERKRLDGLFDAVNMRELISYLKKECRNSTDAAMCEVYSSMYIAFIEFDNESHYKAYRKSIEKNANLLSHNEARFHVLRLVRYCLLKSAGENRNAKFERELFEVYKLFIEKEYYRTSATDYITVDAFRSIVKHCLRLKEYKWTLEFINSFKQKLPPERRKNIFHFASALYFFHTGKHEQSLKHTHLVKYDHFLFRLDLRAIKLMNLYELHAFECAYSCVDSYRHFLKNDKTLSETQINRHRNFIGIVNRLIGYALKKDDGLLISIKPDMKRDVANRQWIEEKLGELRR